MEMQREIYQRLSRLRGVVLFLCALASSGVQAAPVVWNGPMTNFTEYGFDATQPTNQDRITDIVWITRNQTKGIFNAAQESGFASYLSPADTEWADGSASNHSALSFTDWNTWAKNVHGGPPYTVGVPAVVHLISQDIYIDIKFTFWGGASGGFAYTRSTPPPGAAGPVVTITNPPDGSVFAAPASMTVAADASLAGGTVTNVEFFLNGAPLGSVQAAPFTVQPNNLAAGSYQFSAVATGNGLSTTSSVVDVSVVIPIVVSNSAPMVTNGQFSFEYSANPGLRYVVQRSSNLLDWIPVATNTAAGNPERFTDEFVPEGSLYYRVGRLPNP